MITKDLIDTITAAAVEGAADGLHDIQAGEAKYPPDHKAGMRVPKGGSNCAKCEYLADNKTDCTNEYFQKWNGSPKIPLPTDEYCSDWFSPTRNLEAYGTSEGAEKAWDTRGRGRKKNTISTLANNHIDRVGWQKLRNKMRMFGLNVEEEKEYFGKDARTKLFQEAGFTAKQYIDFQSLMQGYMEEYPKAVKAMIVAVKEFQRGNVSNFLTKGVAIEHAITQAYYKEKGIETEKAYRGLTAKQSQGILRQLEKGTKLVDVDLHSVSSWSTSKSAADEFSHPDGDHSNGKPGVLIHSVMIPVDNIITGYRTMRQFAEGGQNELLVSYAGGKLTLPKSNFMSYIGEENVRNKYFDAATEVSLEGDQKGSLWNGIPLTGFTGPEEEGLRAMMSRVPKELFFNVKEIKSAPELNAKHGKFLPDTKTLLFNPRNFSLRQRMGRGDGWMYHAETTVVHELGHSLYDSLSPEEQQSWLQLGNWKKGWSQGQASPYIERRPGWEHETSNWTHKAGLQLPRWYSSKNPNECWADCFAWYILNKKSTLDIAIQNYFDKFIKDHVKAYTSTSIE